MAGKRNPGQQGVLVLGMHRSGTSATAGALEAAGFRLGDRLIEGAVDNPGGYFEHAGVVEVHEQLLDALGRSWDDVRAMPPGWLDEAPASRAGEALAAILSGELAGPVPWVVKDPRACRLLPLWDRVLSGQGTRAGCMFVLRHPDEVAASLWARDRLPSTVAHVLWLRHVVEAEAASRGRPRVLLEYAALLESPGTVLAGALRALGMAAPRGLEAAAGRVDTRARHHGADAGGEAGPWRSLAVDAYESARAAGSVDAIAAIAGALDTLCREHADWLEVVGAVQHSGQARISRWKAEANGAVRAADRLQGHLDEASTLSLQRLRDMEVLDGQLARTTDALQKAESLVAALQADLGGLATAHEQSRALATQRLAELEDATRRAKLAEDAKQSAEGIVEALRGEAATLSAALEEAQGFAEARLRALEATEARIRGTETMLDEARAQVDALSRQVRAERDARTTAEGLLADARVEVTRVQGEASAEAAARSAAEKLLAQSRSETSAEAAARSAAEKLLAQSRAETSAEASARSVAEQLLSQARADAAAEAAGRAAAEALALERLAGMEDLDRRVAESIAAKDLAERLAYDRQAELEALSDEIERMLEALRAAGDRHDRIAERLALLEHGRWWKLGRRLGMAAKPPDRG